MNRAMPGGLRTARHCIFTRGVVTGSGIFFPVQMFPQGTGTEDAVCLSDSFCEKSSSAKPAGFAELQTIKTLFPLKMARAQRRPFKINYTPEAP